MRAERGPGEDTAPTRAPVPGLVLVAVLLTTSVVRGADVEFPWREAGLTEEEASDHLLRRFTFGPRPGDVERVVKEGLESWFAGVARRQPFPKARKAAHADEQQRKCHQHQMAQ